MAGVSLKDLRWTEFPVAFITLINAAAAFYFAYQAFNLYEQADLQRKVWRFVMFAMAFLLLGHFVSMLMRFGFRVDMSRPPTWPDFFGYLWFLPCLLVALLREYRLVRTDAAPNRIMKVGLPFVLLIFAGVVALVSPFFSPSFISLAERVASLWYIAFSFAILIVAVSLLSEIYSGLLSLSWKLIIAAVFVFCLYYAAFIYIGANNLERGSQLIKVAQVSLSQLGTILIAAGAYVESRILG